MVLNIFNIPVKFKDTKEELCNFLERSFVQTDKRAELEYIFNDNITLKLFNKDYDIYKVGNFFISKLEILIDIEGICTIFFSLKNKKIYYELYNLGINTFINEVLLSTLILAQKKYNINTWKLYEL